MYLIKSDKDSVNSQSHVNVIIVPGQLGVVDQFILNHKNINTMATEALEKKPEKENVVELVIGRVKELTTKTGFLLPANYNVDNAVRTAQFIIKDITNKEGKSALEFCTPASIQESLFRMVAQALDPMKKQCYFIPRGNKLMMERSYFGSEAIAKRVAKVEKISASVIFEGDVFDYEMNDGRISKVNHIQKIENLDKPMFGAYCVVTFTDKSQAIDVMTIAQIKNSWKQAQNQNNNKLQTDFGTEAAKRTVINRCLKPIINSSDDSNLYERAFEGEEIEIEETDHTVVTQPKEQPKTISLSVAGKKEEPKPEPVIEEPQAEEVEVETIGEETDPFA